MIEEPDKMNNFFNMMKEFFLGKEEVIETKEVEETTTKEEEVIETKEVEETTTKEEVIETTTKEEVVIETKENDTIKKLEEELSKTKLELQKMIDVENKKKSKRIVIEGSKESISSSEDDDVIREILRDPIKMSQFAEKEPARYSKLMEQYNNNPKKYLKQPKKG